MLTESVYTLSHTVNAPRSLLQWVERGGLEVRHLGLDNVRSVLAYAKKYRDLPMDLADTSPAALSIETGIEHIVSIDRDLNVYRLPNGKPLVNLLQP